MRNVFFYATPVGRIGIADNGEAITNIYFEHEALPKGAVERETKLIRKAGDQLLEYFEGRRREFDLPLAPAGTDFQKQVWNALREIPYGQTRSYGQIAARIGNPKGSRAVGMANNKNPLAIIVPCHRVIGSNGKLVGYAGGLDLKAGLLELEKQPTYIGSAGK